MLKIIHKISKFKAICECSRCNSHYECDFYSASKSRVGDLCSNCVNVLANMKDITQECLLDVFDYNEHTGEVISKVNTAHYSIGEPIGYKQSGGYLSLSLGRKEYLLHRLIWMMKTGSFPNLIDHIDHNRSNNRWNNLREVSPLENAKNTGKSKNNSSGVTGVRILPSGKYCSYIMVNRKQISLGSYDTIDEAVTVRKQAEQQYEFHVNHGN